jgi:hypothetical protein
MNVRRPEDPPPHTLVLVLHGAIGGPLCWLLTPEVTRDHPKLDPVSVRFFILLLWPYFLFLKLMGFLLSPRRHR